MYQFHLYDNSRTAQNDAERLTKQLLKWIGNKQRVAPEVIRYFPSRYRTYYEPFLGSGAVLGTLAPRVGVATDRCEPLIGIWQLVASAPQRLLEAYSERWRRFQKDRDGTYASIKARFNDSPNPDDLLFLSRSCYGGVIRFRKDGYMSTPIGVHTPIPPKALAERVAIWRRRIVGTTFKCSDFEEILDDAREGDLAYCDPPYFDTQAILYGSQSFTLERLFGAITRAKQRGVFVAVSLDGNKKSGAKTCSVSIPAGLFFRSVAIHCGRSMLRRFQMGGETLEGEVVSDRLLLTW